MMNRQTKMHPFRKERKLNCCRGTRPLGQRSLAVEPLEQRTLLAAGLFLQGTAFLDAKNDQMLDAGDTYVPGATIQLFDSNMTLLAKETTGANGAYLFEDGTKGENGPLTLTPGTYYLQEVPPSGFANNGVQSLSPLYAASAVDASTIQVTLVDPSQLTATFDVQGPNLPLAVTTPTHPLNGVYTGQFEMQANLLDGSVVPFNSFCVQTGPSISPGDTFAVLPEPSSMATTQPGTVLPTNAGQIAYLYNHYGTTILTNTQASTILNNQFQINLQSDVGSINDAANALDAGLQVAIWELEYGVNNVSYSVYPPLSSFPTSELVKIANKFLSDSAGKSETCIFLDASSDTGDHQSILAPESFNFANVPTVTPSVDTTIVNANGSARRNRRPWARRSRTQHRSTASSQASVPATYCLALYEI